MKTFFTTSILFPIFRHVSWLHFLSQQSFGSNFGRPNFPRSSQFRAAPLRKVSQSYDDEEVEPVQNVEKNCKVSSTTVRSPRVTGNELAEVSSSSLELAQSTEAFLLAGKPFCCSRLRFALAANERAESGLRSVTDQIQIFGQTSACHSRDNFMHQFYNPFIDRKRHSLHVIAMYFLEFDVSWLRQDCAKNQFS